MEQQQGREVSKRVSNDHDGVSEDGQEPADATPSDEASEQSAPQASAEVAGDSSDKPRTAPAADQPVDPIGADAAALATGPVSAG